MINDISIDPAINNSENKVAFDKKELGKIFKIYGKMVAIGEWKDYGISFLKDFSIFSIYRNSSEYPIYRVRKNPKKFKKKEVFSIVTMDGKIINRGNDTNVGFIWDESNDHFAVINTNDDGTTAGHVSIPSYVPIKSSKVIVGSRG